MFDEKIEFRFLSKRFTSSRMAFILSPRFPMILPTSWKHVYDEEIKGIKKNEYFFTFPCISKRIVRKFSISPGDFIMVGCGFALFN